MEKIEQNNASKVISAEGKLLGLFYYQNRTNTNLKDIPQNLIDALIATEDIRFYNHNGFDTRSFFRVLIKSIFLFDKSAGGGSTISQQLAKNLFPRTDHGLIGLMVTKVKEIITALRLEKIYSKEQILELYLNTVSFGENTYGIETAALTYFNKIPQDLSVPESAVLVGLLKANTGYNPRLHKDAAFKRRNTVINQMVKYGYLDKYIADSLKQLPVVLHYNKLDHIQGPAPYFREFLRQEAEAVLRLINEQQATNYNLYTDGLTIYTSLRADLQNYAEESVKEHMVFLQSLFDKQWQNSEPWKKNINLAKRQIEQSIPYQKLINKGFSYSQIIDSLKTPHPTKVFSWQGERDTIISSLDSILYHFGILQVGMMAMDAHSGKVLAWIGGPDFKYFKYDHVLASRQVGSTIKPLVYAAAIEAGVNPCEYYKNDSIPYAEFDNWVPQNADHKYGGYYSVQGALVNSVNTISVQLLLETGIANTIKKIQKAGISAPLQEVPSLALGSAEIPLYQMIQAYSVFLNKGRVRQPNIIQKITDANGNVIYENPVQKEGEPVFSESTVQIMQNFLMGVTSRGTAAGLRTTYGINYELGGKTGTTQHQTDGWFIGITPEIIVGVWIGGDDRIVRFRNLSSGQGARTAMPVFAKFIQKTGNDKKNVGLVNGSFNIPVEIYKNLDCDDFKESMGLFDFLKNKNNSPEKKERQKKKTTPKNEEKEQSKVGKFLKKVFGKKDKKNH